MKRNNGVVITSLVLVLIFVLTGCGKKTAIEPLFDDIYVKLAKEEDTVTKEDLIDFLDDQKDYEYTYDDSTRSYKVVDPETDNDNYVYIVLYPDEDWVTSFNYYDDEREIEVTTANGIDGKKTENVYWKTHVLGEKNENVNGLEDQIKFLEEY